MAEIVFFCIPAHGHTNPTLGVVRELVSRGHRVHYYSYEPFREKIEAAGAVFVPCDDYDLERRLSPKDSARIGRDLAFSTKILVDTTIALDGAILRDMQALKPDCIVADSMAVWGKAIAGKLDIPFVSSTTTFAFNEHSAKVMKQGLKELLGLLFAMPKINYQLKRLQKAGYPIKNILEILQNDNDTHTIVYTSPEFQPFSDTFSDKYVFVGPSIRPIADTFAKKREKLVYLSMGTVNNDMLPLYRRWVEAFRDSPCQVVLSVGNQVDLKAFGTLPEHIQIFPSVDQIAVLEKADAFVTHCGMNSVSEALWFGVPLVLLPQTAEQNGVAERVLELGAGIRPEQDGDLRRAVERLLSDPAYRANAQRIADTFHACPGAKGAADKILSLCRKP